MRTPSRALTSLPNPGVVRLRRAETRNAVSLFTGAGCNGGLLAAMIWCDNLGVNVFFILPGLVLAPIHPRLDQSGAASRSF
ncbi:MAG: hypothetical protein EXR01_09225 [Acetobacteraceae bacterium]|nr:hypothetical protein [Acetobacteraceae bacterium]